MTRTTATTICLLASFVLLAAFVSAADAAGPGTLQPVSPSGATDPASRSASADAGVLPSNSVIDMEFFAGRLWGATGEGLVRFSPDPGATATGDGSWFVPGEESGFGKGGVSGLALDSLGSGEVALWAATAFDTLVDGQEYPAGGGVGYSLDFGETWTWMPQPVDSADAPGIQPTRTNVQNITYDIGMLEGRVWIASWGGGLRYLDMDADTLRWINRPPDENPYDVLTYMNHRAFSVAVLDTQLWVGTAAGVNLSLDNGASWRNFRHEDGREETLSGNFVPALGAQRTSGGVSRIWAATWVVSSDGDEFYGVSVSEDDGSTWRRVLGSPEEPVRAHNFAFDDSTAYVASDQGFYKSVDGGRSWGRFPSPRDDVSGERFYGEEVFSAATGPELLFLGGPEGLALSANGGLDWSIARSYPPPGGVNPETGAQVPSAYAYPNPFSPSRFPAVRFQYEMKRPGTVTLEVYDFAMELVVRPVKDKPRGEGTWNEVWDGYRADGESVANGVYFFRLTGGGQERWGKVLVLD